MKKYVWFTRDFIFLQGYTDWRIESTEVEIISETETLWNIQYNGAVFLFWEGVIKKWISKDSYNKLEEIRIPE